jgi:hypothetical protein
VLRVSVPPSVKENRYKILLALFGQREHAAADIRDAFGVLEATHRHRAGLLAALYEIADVVVRVASDRDARQRSRPDWLPR